MLWFMLRCGSCAGVLMIATSGAAQELGAGKSKRFEVTVDPTTLSPGDYVVLAVEEAALPTGSWKREPKELEAAVQQAVKDVEATQPL